MKLSIRTIENSSIEDLAGKIDDNDFTTTSVTNNFCWESYLIETGSSAAPAHCFFQTLEIPENKFEPQMKLEAQDPRCTSNTCIASVIDVSGPRLRLRLDGLDNRNDFWRLVDSHDIHPFGYAHSRGILLLPPVGYGETAQKFSRYLTKLLSNGDHQAAEQDYFKAIDVSIRPTENRFQVGMKLEAVDQKKPSLIAPATVIRVDADRILLRFDGYKSFDFWGRYDSRDLFPCGWCQRAGLKLTDPPLGKKKGEFISSPRNVDKSSLLESPILLKSLSALQRSASMTSSVGSVDKSKSRGLVVDLVSDMGGSSGDVTMTSSSLDNNGLPTGDDVIEDRQLVDDTAANGSGDESSSAVLSEKIKEASNDGGGKGNFKDDDDVPMNSFFDQFPLMMPTKQQQLVELSPATVASIVGDVAAGPSTTIENGVMMLETTVPNLANDVKEAQMLLQNVATIIPEKPDAITPASKTSGIGGDGSGNSTSMSSSSPSRRLLTSVAALSAPLDTDSDMMTSPIMTSSSAFSPPPPLQFPKAWSSTRATRGRRRRNLSASPPKQRRRRGELTSIRGGGRGGGRKSGATPEKTTGSRSVKRTGGGRKRKSDGNGDMAEEGEVETNSSSSIATLKQIAIDDVVMGPTKKNGVSSTGQRKSPLPTATVAAVPQIVLKNMPDANTTSTSGSSTIAATTAATGNSVDTGTTTTSGDASSTNLIVPVSSSTTTTTNRLPHKPDIVINIPAQNEQALLTIHLNPHCAGGSLLDASKLALLPLQIGPFTLNHALRECIQQLVNCAQCNRSVLKALPAGDGQLVVTADIDGKTTGRHLPFMGCADMAWHYLRHVLRRFGACPNMLCQTAHPCARCSPTAAVAGDDSTSPGLSTTTPPPPQHQSSTSSGSVRPEMVVLQWSVDDVCTYLSGCVDRSIALLVPAFRQAEIDGASLLQLNTDLLVRFMQLPLGSALKIEQMIANLRSAATHTSGSGGGGGGGANSSSSGGI